MAYEKDKFTFRGGMLCFPSAKHKFRGKFPASGQAQVTQLYDGLRSNQHRNLVVTTGYVWLLIKISAKLERKFLVST